MSVIDTRRQQMFPVLEAGQIETASRFASGPARDFAPNEIVFAVGERRAPSWLVLKGSINTLRRDGLDREAAITTHRPGQFSGDIDILTGRPVIVSAIARGVTRVLRVPHSHLRALLNRAPTFGEKLIVAFTRRRELLSQLGSLGLRIVGPGRCRDTIYRCAAPPSPTTRPPPRRARRAVAGAGGRQRPGGRRTAPPGPPGRKPDALSRQIPPAAVQIRDKFPQTAFDRQGE